MRLKGERDAWAAGRQGQGQRQGQGIGLGVGEVGVEGRPMLFAGR